MIKSTFRSAIRSQFPRSLTTVTILRSISNTMGEAHNPAPTPKKLINLLKGWPSPSLLPISAIAHASQSILSDPKISIPALSYGPDPGFQPLRIEISKWVNSFYPRSSFQSSPTPEENSNRICITGGASQNLACVLQVFSDPVVTKVWVVAPCYFLACAVFEDAGLRCNGVGEGGHGIDLEGLERGIMESEKNGGEGVEPLKRTKPSSKIYKHIIYCVPTFSNPSGKTMPLHQRQKLVLLARKHDALIITDDVYDFLQWPTGSNTNDSSSLKQAVLPRLVDIDRTLEPIPSDSSFGNAMSNGSFSKITGPGVRTGWSEATPKFIFGLSQCGSTASGGAPSQLVAAMMSQLLSTGALQDHISNFLVPAYKKRFEMLVSAVEKHLIPLGVTLGEISFGEEGKEVFGGYFVWIELPEGVDSQIVAQRAKEEENLIVAGGRIFEVRGDDRFKFQKELRLCFAWEDEEDLVEGVRRLGGVLERVVIELDGASQGKMGRSVLAQALAEFK